MRRLRLVAQGLVVGLVALLLGHLGWKIAQPDGGQIAAAVARGEQPAAPGIDLPLLNGEGTLSLASLRGKPVVINFWGAWCYACKADAPFLQRAHERYGADGLVLVGVDTNDFRSSAHRFLKRYGWTFPNVYDGPGKTAERYGTRRFPETFFVDRDGKVRATILGAINTDTDRQRFNRAVATVLAPT